jgi:hypothetical protein
MSKGYEEDTGSLSDIAESCTSMYLLCVDTGRMMRMASRAALWSGE